MPGEQTGGTARCGGTCVGEVGSTVEEEVQLIKAKAVDAGRQLSEGKLMLS